MLIIPHLRLQFALNAQLILATLLDIKHAMKSRVWYLRLHCLLSFMTTNHCYSVRAYQKLRCSITLSLRCLICWQLEVEVCAYLLCHGCFRVRTPTTVMRIAMVVCCCAVLLKFSDPFQVRWNSKQRTLYTKTRVGLYSLLERKQWDIYWREKLVEKTLRSKTKRISNTPLSLSIARLIQLFSSILIFACI